MIIIHFLILLSFIALFVMSSGIRCRTEKKDSAISKAFKRMAVFIQKRFNMRDDAEIIKKQVFLNPAAKGRKEADNYRTKKISEVLLCIFAGNLLALIVAVYSMNAGNDVENYYIDRNGYGGGDRIVELNASVGEKEIEEPIEVSVGERQYTNAETERIFDEIGRDLPERILGENQSTDRVEYDLLLADHDDRYPVDIEWSVDDYDILDSSGVIQDDAADVNGTPVVLTASLSYMGQHADYMFPVIVYPRHREAAGKIRDILKRKIAKYESITISMDKLRLPGKIGDMDIKYRRTPDTAAAYIVLATVIIIFVIWFGRDRDLDKLIKLRDREMLTDYPEIVSRLSLFFSAGMTIRGAFEKIAGDYERQLRTGRKEKRYAFEEMLITVREMKGGVPEFQAYQNFGTRSGVRRYGKLGTLLSQNLKKGNRGITEALESEARDAFEDRKAEARRAGEEAGTRLLLPMGIMLLVVMIIVILPAFMSFSSS